MNVSVSPLGLCAGNGRVESVFLCVGSGCGWRVSKSGGPFFFFGNLSGDHPSQEGSRQAGALLYFAFMGEL